MTAPSVLYSIGDGLTCVVDAEDVPRLAEHAWWSQCAREYKGERYVYARTSIGGRTVLMHRFILNAPDDRDVDHINRDRLDNRKANLRLCTHAENMRNRKDSLVQPAPTTAFNRAGLPTIKRFEGSPQRLSDREFQVFHAIAAGHRLSVIAGNLNLSPSTVGTLRSRALQKLGLSTNADIIRLAAGIRE